MRRPRRPAPTTPRRPPRRRRRAGRRTFGRPPGRWTLLRRRAAALLVLALATAGAVALAGGDLPATDDLPGTDGASGAGAAVAPALGPSAAPPTGSPGRIADPPRQEALGPLPIPSAAIASVDLARPSAFALRLRPAPKAGIAIDLADGRVLWRRGATRRRPIASLTKLMTALLAVERLGASDRVRVPRAADQVGGSRMGGLKPGRRVRAEVLLTGLMLASGNDAAVTLATAVAGSEKAFVEIMNRRAQRLGLTCTRYADSHGLDARNRSCPADLAVLAARGMSEPRIARVAARRFARVWPGSGRKLTLRTTNPLLRERYPGAIGLKTGYTVRAGRCLVTVVQRGGRRVGIVLLGSRDPGDDARRIVRAAARASLLPAA